MTSRAAAGDPLPEPWQSNATTVRDASYRITDTDKARTFYGGLFGWGTSEFGGDYHVIDNGPAGAIAPREDGFTHPPCLSPRPPSGATGRGTLTSRSPGSEVGRSGAAVGSGGSRAVQPPSYCWSSSPAAGRAGPADGRNRGRQPGRPGPGGPTGAGRVPLRTTTTS